jgi:UrcA family protein
MRQIETKSRLVNASEQGALSTWAFAGIAGIFLGSVGMSAMAGPPDLSLTVPGIRSAGDPDVRSTVVRYGELNLQSDKAIVILYKRIAAAADYVCSAYVNRSNLSVTAKWSECHSSAVSRAVSDIGQPRLTQYLAQIRHQPVKSVTLAAR